MKKRVLSILAVLAVAVNMVGCTPPNAVPSEDLNAGVQSETTVTETTTVQTEEQNVYETLAEGQERDWKIEDVLKNDLSIDGIPISIPCTVGELLDTLGNDYDIDDDNTIIRDGVDSRVMVHFFESEDEENKNNCLIKSIGWYESTDNICVLTTQAPSSNYQDFLTTYSSPELIQEKKDRKYIRYTNNGYYLSVSFKNDIIDNIRIGLNEEAVK